MQIAAVSTDDGPALYALTDEGEIYEYGMVSVNRDVDVGMWSVLSSISPENILDNEDAGGEEEEEDDDEGED